jgi:uncharacterized protein YndB with AHSA1/START domain
MLPVIIVGAVVVVLIAVVLIIGARLPVDHQATRSVILGAAPERVWTAVTDVENFPSWRPHLKRVEILPLTDGHLTWREHDRHGKITFEAVETQEPRLFRTRIADKKLPFGGTWTYVIEPADSGSKLTVTEDGKIYNLLFRFISRYFIGYTGTMDRYLQAISAELA